MALVNRVVAGEAGAPFSITVVEDDVAHKWVSVVTVNSYGRAIRVTGTFSGQPFSVDVPDGTNRSDNINVQLVQITNVKGQLVWSPPTGFSIGYAFL